MREMSSLEKTVKRRRRQNEERAERKEERGRIGQAEKGDATETKRSDLIWTGRHGVGSRVSDQGKMREHKRRAGGRGQLRSELKREKKETNLRLSSS